MLRPLHISIKRHSKRFVDGRKYQGPPWIDPWSEGSKYFDTGTNWKEASPQKLIVPTILRKRVRQRKPNMTQKASSLGLIYFVSAKTRDFHSRTKCVLAIAFLFIHRWQNINNWFSMAPINPAADSSTFAESKQLHSTSAATMYNPICYPAFLRQSTV